MWIWKGIPPLHQSPLTPCLPALKHQGGAFGGNSGGIVVAVGRSDQLSGGKGDRGALLHQRYLAGLWWARPYDLIARCGGWPAVRDSLFVAFTRRVTLVSKEGQSKHQEVMFLVILERLPLSVVQHHLAQSGSCGGNWIVSVLLSHDDSSFPSHLTFGDEDSHPRPR